MHADLSRLTFRPERHYSAVIAQQGRVQLDADANEQTAIQLHQARTLAADLIGQHGGPRGAAGFRIDFVGGSRELDDLSIGGGRYYVDGILRGRDPPAARRPGRATSDGRRRREEGEDGAPPAAAARDLDVLGPARRLPRPGAARRPAAHRQFPYLVYLKVWERLGHRGRGPGAARGGAGRGDAGHRGPRARWSGRCCRCPAAAAGPGRRRRAEGRGPRRVRQVGGGAGRARPPAGGPQRAARPRRRGPLPGQARTPATGARRTSCTGSRSTTGGAAKDATFKWSRENGSVTFPVDELDGTWVELASLGSDDKLDLDVGDWVEFVDTAYTSRGEPLPLLRVEEVDLPGRRVRLSGEPDAGRRTAARAAPVPAPLGPPRRRPRRGKRRRSDRGSSTAHCRSRRAAGCRWRTASRSTSQPGGTYRTGDFWTDPGAYGHRQRGMADGRGPPAAAAVPGRDRRCTTRRWPGCWARAGARSAAGLRAAGRAASRPRTRRRWRRRPRQARRRQHARRRERPRTTRQAGAEQVEDHRAGSRGHRGRRHHDGHASDRAPRLLKVLRDEGLVVHEVRSWRTHNRNHKGPWGPVHGVMIHHTVT